MPLECLHSYCNICIHIHHGAGVDQLHHQIQPTAFPTIRPEHGGTDVLSSSVTSSAHKRITPDSPTAFMYIMSCAAPNPANAADHTTAPVDVDARQYGAPPRAHNNQVDLVEATNSTVLVLCHRVLHQGLYCLPPRH